MYVCMYVFVFVCFIMYSDTWIQTALSKRGVNAAKNVTVAFWTPQVNK